MGANTFKVKSFYKNIMSSFLFLVTFSYEGIFEIFCNLFLKIHVVAYYIIIFVLGTVE